jgi:hypothetical protein
MPAGRPSKYDPSYCDVVVDLGKQGKSIAQMCAHFDIARSTIDKWAEDHAEFSEALSRARVHSQAWWEETGVTGMTADKFNSQIWVKTVQARFREDYTERQEVTGAGGGPIQTEELSARDVARRIAFALAAGLKE